MGVYVADFACLKAKLIIELDGEQHALGSGLERDARRDAWFESQGFRTMRFWNHDVLQNPEGIAETILRAVSRRLDRSPPP
jgi:very-short-patch-repair endonuclease